MIPLPDLPSVEEHFVASGRQVLLLVGVAALEPGDILGVAHAPLLSVPLNVLQQDNRAPSPPSGLSEVSSVSAVIASPVAAPASPSPALLERLSPEQRASFLHVWARLSLHLREVAIDLHGTDWTPEAIEQLGDALCAFPDVFSKSKSDFGSCLLIPFVISVPEGCAPVTSRPHRINPFLAEEVEATLGPESSSRSDAALDLSVLEPAGGHPKKSWRRLDHREKTQPDQQSQPAAYSSRGPSPRLPGEGAGVLSLRFSLLAPPDTVHKDTVPLAAVCTPTGLYEWHVMPQGSGVSPGWFVKVINETFKGLAQVVAYLDDVIVFDSDPTAHVKTIRALFERLCKY